jgi:hypothetical protein
VLGLSLKKLTVDSCIYGQGFFVLFCFFRHFKYKMTKMMKGVNSTMICSKNFCKCHNVPQTQQYALISVWYFAGVCVFSLEMGSCYTSQADLELMIL